MDEQEKVAAEYIDPAILEGMQRARDIMAAAEQAQAAFNFLYNLCASKHGLKPGDDIQLADGLIMRRS